MKRFFLSLFILCSFVKLIDAQERNFQLSLITPLGSNGIDSHRITNKVSINLLGGYSYGNTKIELGGLYNINTHYTKGIQLAGILNYSGNSHHATQLAGIINIAHQGSTSFQIAGITNFSQEVKGLQLAGIINLARQVKGVQFGLINIAEESDGISIGLLNFIKKNGKHELEISFSESLNTAISFKLGTNKFYTIISGGIKYIGKPIEYGVGLGFGTHIQWKKNWSNQIELIGYEITNNGSFKHNGINLLTQLKLPISKQFTKHLHVFAGPVINISISDLKDPNTGTFINSISPWSIWDYNSESIKFNGWIGFMAGLRF